MIKDAVSSSRAAAQAEALLLELPTAAATKRLGATLGKLAEAGDLIGLCGPLGAGKTCLVSGLGRGLSVRGAVTSPTFTLLHSYGENQVEKPVFHGDLYRIENFHDFETLGMEDLFSKPGVVILEWAERFPLPSPWPEMRIRLEHLGGDSRRISVL